MYKSGKGRVKKAKTASLFGALCLVYEQGYVNRKKNYRRYEICDSNNGD